MVSLFGILNLGASSLTTETAETAVTGQNLANVNNPAYARQQVNVGPTTPLNTMIGQEGTGITAISITEVRDALLDGQIQTEAGVTGSLNSQQQALQQAEAALGEEITNQSTSGSDSSPNGLAAGLSNLFDALQSLSASPSSTSLRQAVIASAQQLATQFNQVNSQLTALTTTINSSMDADVTSANQDLTKIATLNQQIVQAQAVGGTANEMIDEREAALEDLSSKLNFTTSTQANGAINVTIGGATMVSGITQTDSLKNHFDPLTGRYSVADANGGTTLTLSGGSLEGDMTVRDGPLAQLQTSVNTLATQLISSVNNIYSSGFDLNGNTGQAFFTGTDASTIGVNSALSTNPSQFQASGSATATGDNSVALALAQLANTSLAGLNNQTITNNYSGIVAGLGNAASSVNSQLTDNGAVTQMLTTQRGSISGVNMDEEMTNLLQFQKAYEASAELITTVNQMLQTVVSMKTT